VKAFKREQNHKLRQVIYTALSPDARNVIDEAWREQHLECLNWDDYFTWKDSMYQDRVFIEKALDGLFMNQNRLDVHFGLARASDHPEYGRLASSGVVGQKEATGMLNEECSFATVIKHLDDFCIGQMRDRVKGERNMLNEKPEYESDLEVIKSKIEAASKGTLRGEQAEIVDAFVRKSTGGESNEKSVAFAGEDGTSKQSTSSLESEDLGELEEMDLTVDEKEMKGIYHRDFENNLALKKLLLRSYRDNKRSRNVSKGSSAGTYQTASSSPNKAGAASSVGPQGPSNLLKDQLQKMGLTTEGAHESQGVQALALRVGVFPVVEFQGLL